MALPIPTPFRRTLALVAVAVLAACGGSDSNPNQTPDNPSPTVSGVTPSSVVAGDAGFTLTVNGSSFIQSSTVRWNGSARQTTYVSGTQLTAAITAGDIAAPGTAEITVVNPAPGGGQSAPASVTITPAAVASVTLAPNSGTLVPQQTLAIEATPRSGDGTPLAGRTVTWSSSDDAVASVSQDGLVLAVAPGPVTIRATSEGIDGEAQLTVVAGGMVGPAGGSVTLPGGAVVLEFPAGAVSAPTAITIAENANPPAHPDLIPGTSWTLGPNGTNFAEPVTVRIRYEAAGLPPGSDPDDFVVHRWDGAAWVPLENTVVDTGAGTVSGTTQAFSPFAILSVAPPPPTFQSLEAGGTQSCGVLVGGMAYCWGWDDDGQLGWGLNMDSFDPVAVVGDHIFQYITAGFDHTCGLRADQVALCWGAGNYGQLGRGFVGSASTPQLVVNGGMGFDVLTAGYDHTCGLVDDGTARCWGRGWYGVLGAGGTADFSTPDSSTPIMVAGGHVFEFLEAGGYHTCGRKANGEIWCWGWGDDGQLGDGNDVDRSTPIQLPGGQQFVHIALGGYHTCGLTEAGVASCWGWNGHGGLGNGNTDTQLSPVPVLGGLQFASLSAGAEHTCGLTPDGVAHCWGHGEYGQLGNGQIADSSVPVPVSGGLLFQSLSAGDDHTCGLTLDGEGYCWGWGEGVGHGTGIDALVPTRVEIPNGVTTAPGAFTSPAAPSGDRPARRDHRFE